MADGFLLMSVTDAERFIEGRLKEVYGVVSLVCHKYTNQIMQDEIDDLCQEVVLWLIENDYRRLRLFDNQKSSFMTWLKAVVRHYISNYIRRQKITGRLEEIPPEYTLYQTTQESLLLRKEKQGLLQSAISRLSARERQLLELLCIDEMSGKEVAELMGIKYESVLVGSMPLSRSFERF